MTICNYNFTFWTRRLSSYSFCDEPDDCIVNPKLNLYNCFVTDGVFYFVSDIISFSILRISKYFFLIIILSISNLKFLALVRL